MPRLYLHIGSHKTGTTAIQSFARTNQDELRQQGLWYPDYSPISDRKADAHHDLSHAIAGDSKYYDLPTLEELVHYWFKTASKTGDDILLSAEPFWRHIIDTDGHKSWFEGRRLLFARVADLLNSFDVTVVVVLRRQDDYIRSLYQELVMKSASLGQLSFLDFRKRFFKIREEDEVAVLLDEFLKTACYDDNLTLVEEAFNNVMVTTYEELVSSNNLCTSFFDSLAINAQEFNDVDLVRQSWAPELTEVKRLLNERLPGYALNKKINNLLFSDQVQWLFDKHFIDRPYCLWETPDAQKCFLESFTEENEQIRIRYFPHRNYLFPPFKEEEKVSKLPEITHEFLADLVITLL